MRRLILFTVIISSLSLAGCARPTTIIDHEPFDWSSNVEILRELDCLGKLGGTCPELAVLGCDEVQPPRFIIEWLDPPYPVLECIHAYGEPSDLTYFRQVPGLDTRYRTFAVHQDGTFRLLIKKSDFRAFFAPIDSPEEAISYAMAMTSFEARFDLDRNPNVDYLVKHIDETHAEETAEGYLVYLFDWSHRMGCQVHPFYAVQVLVTPEGDVQEAARQKIYESYSCFDFDVLRLDED